MRKYFRIGTLSAAISLYASLCSADAITFHYVVTITERASIVQIGSTPVDPRVGLSLGTFEDYDAKFRLAMTFDVVLGQASGSGFGTDQALFTVYGMPTFSRIPLLTAAPLVSLSDPGAETNFFGQAFEQQGLNNLSGSGYTNWGAYVADTVQIPGVAQSGSTTLLTHIRPASLTGPDDFQLVPLATYLEHMSGDLEFDFVTWSIFNLSSPGEGFSADSYNYRGTARAVPGEPVPEPSTLLLMAMGLVVMYKAQRSWALSRLTAQT